MARVTSTGVVVAVCLSLLLACIHGQHADDAVQPEHAATASPSQQGSTAAPASSESLTEHRLRGTTAAAWRRRLLDPYHMSFDKISGLALSVPVPKAYSFPIDTELETATYYFVWVSGVYQLAYDVKLSHPADVYLFDEAEFESWKQTHREPWLFKWQDAGKRCFRCKHWKAIVDVDVDSKWYLVIVNHSRTEKLQTSGLIVAHGRSDNTVHRLLLGADSAVIAAVMKARSAVVSTVASILTPGWLRMLM